MSRDLWLDRRGALRRAALVVEGRLTDLQLDRTDRPSLQGAILMGKVARVAAGLDGAFVEIGGGPAGLLNASDVRRPPSDRLGGKKRGDGSRPRDAGIGQLVRAGEAVLVQVKADAHGAKGPALTMDVTLPGRFLVHAPLGGGLHLSRRIAAGPERARVLGLLKQAVPPGGGWIIRAAAVDAFPEVLIAEAELLWARWRDIAGRVQGVPPATVLAPQPSAWERALTEHLAGSARIVADGEEVADAARLWLTGNAPDRLDGLVRHTGPLPLFETGDVEGDIARLLGVRVPLSHGGSLVIERTEAMTVIDVNGGERGNPAATNLEACVEIARQLRLRNVGGIVVVDFIDPGGAAGRERLVQAMSGALADDPAGAHVHGLSRLGLMEITRARRGPPVGDLLLDLPAA